MVYHQARLDRTFSALADPTRRQILARLARREHTIGELAAGFDMSLPAVSKHVRVLEGAGLARVRKEGRSRVTRLVARPMRDAAAWMERYRRFWEHQLDLLAAYMERTPSEHMPPDHTTEDPTCPTPHGRSRPARASKSAASSRPRASRSSARGPTRKSSGAGTRRAR